MSHPPPDTLRLDWQERDPSYGAGANTFLGSQLWTGDEPLPYTRIPMRGGRNNLPRNWQIVGQTANATQIRPYLDASHMSVDDPAVVAERQATAAQRRLNDRALTDNPALTGDPQVENRLPWYMLERWVPS